MKKIGFALVGLLVAAVMAKGTPASATTIGYFLDTTSSCACGTSPYGSVVLNDAVVPGSVDITVNLFFGNRFVTTGHDAAFAFNLTGIDPAITVTILTPLTGFALNSPNPGSVEMDGFGAFEYGLHTTTGPGGSSPVVGPLSFRVTAPGGLTVARFTENSLIPPGSIPSFFAADIISGQTGLTGVVGTGDTPCLTCTPEQFLFPAPEPTSLILLGSGLLAATRGLRRFKR